MSDLYLEKLFEQNHWANQQIINHATEHREQIKSMLTALGVTPPEIDGWDYGMFTKNMLPVNG